MIRKWTWKNRTGRNEWSPGQRYPNQINPGGQCAIWLRPSEGFGTRVEMKPCVQDTAVMKKTREANGTLSDVIEGTGTMAIRGAVKNNVSAKHRKAQYAQRGQHGRGQTRRSDHDPD